MSAGFVSADSMQQNVKQEHPLWVGAFLLGLFCFCIYLLLLRYAVLYQDGQWNWNAFVTGNETSHFVLVQALVEGHTFILDAFLPPVPLDLSTYAGHYYSNKPPGFALLVAPGYMVFRYVLLPLWDSRPIPDFLPLFPAALASLAVVLTYLLAVELGLRRKSAAIGALVAGLATIQVVYAVSFMNNIASTTFLLLALWSAFRYRKTRRWFFLFLAAFSSGYSVLINFSTSVVMLPMGFYLLWVLSKGWRRPYFYRDVAIFLASSLVPLIFLGFYNFRCFGNPFVTAYSHYQAPDYVQFDDPVEAYTGGNLFVGLWGFLFSASKGVFVYTPILGLALPGLYMSLRGKHYRQEWLTVAATIAANIVLFAQYRYWYGGHFIGPRHILPILPLVALLMACCLDYLPRWMRTGVGLFALPSMVVHLMLGFLQHDERALCLSWQQDQHNYLGHLYTDILPLFTTTSVDVWGNGLFRVVKLALLVVALVLAWRLGVWWSREA
ncbi:MAG TPA: glycosyltransferase family 39 protein [Anaerolineae bacterium]|nr:glycosyltransferase family 39 protein [Anaerolineae bacterium]HQH39358.1 glycosyltransferase family 39 protein [Anaerolineae bacterium]